MHAHSCRVRERQRPHSQTYQSRSQKYKSKWIDENVVRHARDREIFVCICVMISNTLYVARSHGNMAYKEQSWKSHKHTHKMAKLCRSTCRTICDVKCKKMRESTKEASNIKTDIRIERQRKTAKRKTVNRWNMFCYKGSLCSHANMCVCVCAHAGASMSVCGCTYACA